MQYAQPAKSSYSYIYILNGENAKVLTGCWLLASGFRLSFLSKLSLGLELNSMKGQLGTEGKAVAYMGSHGNSSLF